MDWMCPASEIPLGESERPRGSRKMLQMIAVLGDMARKRMAAEIGPVSYRVSRVDLFEIEATGSEFDDLMMYMADYDEFDYTVAFPGDDEPEHVICSFDAFHGGWDIALLNGFDKAALHHLANAAKGGEQ